MGWIYRQVNIVLTPTLIPYKLKLCRVLFEKIRKQVFFEILILGLYLIVTGGYILTFLAPSGGGKNSKIWKQGREFTQFSNLGTLYFRINGRKLSEFSSLPCFGKREDNSLTFLIWKHFILRINGRKLSEFFSLPCFGNREENSPKSLEN